MAWLAMEANPSANARIGRAIAVGDGDVRRRARHGQQKIFPQVLAIKSVGHPLDERALFSVDAVLLGRTGRAVRLW